MKKTQKIVVIVTVMDRVKLLRRCLKALQQQTFQNFTIYVVSNGSQGQVEEMLHQEFPEVQVLSFEDPLGSAGAYKLGLKKAYEEGAEWFWLMDDDVHPDKKALENLVSFSKLDSSNTFASVDLDEKGSGDLAWYNNLLIDSISVQAKRYSDLPNTELVESEGIGYMGLFLPKEVIKKAGYPNEKLFIWADDVDYYLRIKNAGFRQFFVRNSLIYHPKANYRNFKLLGKSVYATLGSPWREYYQIRNNIWVWAKYEGRMRTYLMKVPKQFVLWMFILFRFHDERTKRFRYYLKAFFDGVTGRLGMRVRPGQ